MRVLPITRFTVGRHFPARPGFPALKNRPSVTSWSVLDSQVQEDPRDRLRQLGRKLRKVA